MKTNKALLAFALLSLVALRASTQASLSQPRITAAIDNANLTVLHGNTYPLARAQYDRGPAPANLPMQHILMVLKRSPAQEAALESFMGEQLDPSSANYHHWLTPTEFGETYGPAQQDIDAITKWLSANGFQVEKVGAGRGIIQFSGTAGDVQSAFHTTIHQYVVNGKQHWANSSDPSIPTALAPVVAGIRSLHNFYPKPDVRPRGESSRRPNFTFGNVINGTSESCDIAGASTNCYTVGPNDFATIYNVQEAWNNNIDGAGETIAIVADSNIENVSPNDVQQFRALFGLTGGAFNVVLPNGAVSVNDDETEALLDSEWSGAVAKNATIDLVASPSSANGGTFGGDLSAEYVIDYPNATHTNTSTGFAPILSESFGECELGLGSGASGGNAFYNTMWQQAAAEGITVLVSAGDNGSAGCDIDEVNGPIDQPAENGLQVNGVASTPYNVAVGGTDFNDIGFETTGGPHGDGYWNPAPGTVSSALSYIPETAWDDTCTNPEVVLLAGVANAVTSCSNSTVQGAGLVEVTGGSGGASNCISTNSNNGLPSSCTGGYAKPCWQGGPITASCTQNSGVTTPADNARDLPDVSLFAGDGLAGSFYVMCEEDSFPPEDEEGSGLGQSGASCALGASPVFLGVGGTSVSVQAFAGMMALVDQVNGPQGNANPILYKLFADQNDANCISNPPTGTPPASGCVFNDITVGAGGAVATNSMPCAPGSTDCSTTVTASLPLLPRGPQFHVNVEAVRIACALGIGLLLLFGVRRKQHQRWSVMAASLAMVLLIASVGCGGSSGTGEGGNPPPGTPEGVLAQGSTLAFSTGTGYDLVTGLGSVNAYNLTELWSGAEVPVAPPDTMNRPTVTVPIVTLALACALCLGLLFIGLRRRQIRWTTVVLLLAFALSILSAARSNASTRPRMVHPASLHPAAAKLVSFTASHR